MFLSVSILRNCTTTLSHVLLYSCISRSVHEMFLEENSAWLQEVAINLRSTCFMSCTTRSRISVLAADFSSPLRFGCRCCSGWPRNSSW
jgi:hypothetical protein